MKQVFLLHKTASLGNNKPREAVKRCLIWSASFADTESMGDPSERARAAARIFARSVRRAAGAFARRARPRTRRIHSTRECDYAGF